MANVTKTLVNATITLDNGDSITVTDTDTAAYGAYVVSCFKKHADMDFVDSSNARYLIPFHAIVKIEVSTSTGTKEITDSSCEE